MPIIVGSVVFCQRRAPPSLACMRPTGSQGDGDYVGYILSFSWTPQKSSYTNAFNDRNSITNERNEVSEWTHIDDFLNGALYACIYLFIKNMTNRTVYNDKNLSTILKVKSVIK